ncbi:VOC family protein [Planctomicrobium sp. SH668]|uniref:VOC family protein n=1 Tax=Planctomicrobium sp. SH668 TaxID=3448126 RepID=UPI003F5C9383
MSQPLHRPLGFHTITPYLIVSDAVTQIEFLKATFDAQEILRMPSPSGGVAHAQLLIGDSPLELADETPVWNAMPASLHIYVSDIDETFQRSVKAGAEVLLEPEDHFYGERSASVRDPLGNIWHIATKTEDLTPEELRRRTEGGDKP